MTSPSAAPLSPTRGPASWWILLLPLTALLAYSDSFKVPFVFDDGPAIVENRSIRSLRLPARMLAPPPGLTVSGRPVANLTLALNYAISGLQPWSYHAFNLGVLIGGAMVLRGIVGRTLKGAKLAVRFEADADWLATFAALLWMLHPVQTESVTYIVQRVESLMGLFYLLTLYCFIRSATAVRRSGWWQVAAVAACLLGMATKEVMVTAPLLVLAYDRVFFGSSWSEIWGRRRRFYSALALCWLMLLGLVAGTGFSRNGSAGFSGEFAASDYWLIQLQAISRYAHLALWPDSLTLDYGPVSAGPSPPPLSLQGLFTIGLCLLTVWAAIKHPLVGFLGAWFLVILGPTTIVPVGTQAIAEHRLFLSLAAVAVLVAVTLYHFARRRAFAALALIAVVEGVFTFRRNATYRDLETIWSDTVAKVPENPRAHCSLGQTLAQLPNRLPEAIEQFQIAVRLHPNYSEAHADLGMALARQPGHIDDAISELQSAVRIRPTIADWQSELGALLCAAGRSIEGVEHLQVALRLEPRNPRRHYFMGNALAQNGQITDAQAQYEEALRLDPDFAEASNNLGILLCRTGHLTEGLVRIRSALATNPKYAAAHFSLGLALLQLGRRAEATSEFEAVLQLKPEDAGALHMLQLLQSNP